MLSPCACADIAGLVLAPRSFVHQKDIAYLVNMAAGAPQAATSPPPSPVSADSKTQ